MSRLVRLCVERTGDVLWIDPSTVARVSGAEPHGTIQCTRIVLRDGYNLVVAGLPDTVAMLVNEQVAPRKAPEPAACVSVSPVPGGTQTWKLLSQRLVGSAKVVESQWACGVCGHTVTRLGTEEPTACPVA